MRDFFICDECGREECWTKADTYEYCLEEGCAVQSNFPQFRECEYCEALVCATCEEEGEHECWNNSTDG